MANCRQQLGSLLSFIPVTFCHVLVNALHFLNRTYLRAECGRKITQLETSNAVTFREYTSHFEPDISTTSEMPREKTWAAVLHSTTTRNMIKKYNSHVRRVWPLQHMIYSGTASIHLISNEDSHSTTATPKSDQNDFQQHAASRYVSICNFSHEYSYVPLIVPFVSLYVL